MPDVLELSRATAIASGEWSRHGEHCSWIAWAKDPDATVRSAVFFTHGGAETNWEDLELTNNTTYLMLVNELNCVLISYDVSPGFFRIESGEGTSSKDVFEKQLEHAAAIAYLRSILGLEDNTVLPSGMRITTDPDLSMHAGSSSGAYDALRCQFMPSGSLPNSRDRVIRGEGRFARVHGYECNVVLANITQVSLSQFCEYRVDPLLVGVDGTYETNTPATVTAAGSGTIAIDGDTAALYRANRIQYTVASTTYTHAIKVDFAGGAGTVSVFPVVPVNIPDNTPIVFVHANAETYGELSWAQQYLFSAASGYVWRSDDASGDGFPMDIKVQADVDYMLDLTNPRVYEVSVFFNGADVDSLITSALTGEQSFLNNWTPGVPHYAYIDLHGAHQPFYFAWWLYEVAGNTDVVVYCGDSTVNVNYGDPSVPWNKGRNGDFSPSVLKTYLQARGW
jgi:hypothetical protein